MRTIGHWVDGRAVAPEGSRTSPVWNPATGVQQGEVLLAGADVVGGAVGSAVEVIDFVLSFIWCQNRRNNKRAE